MAAEPRAQQHHLHCRQDNVAANAPRSPLPHSPVAGGHAQHPLHLLRQAGPCLPHRSQPRRTRRSWIQASSHDVVPVSASVPSCCFDSCTLSILSPTLCSSRRLCSCGSSKVIP
ncbi:hypothetical protein PVAP13_7KG054063 [Panicum virgatum]|uniref:Uncharacterized protein n=1 Tax=Panicum virgatum TaxID=38727 RepID=A0A8T0QAY2_PANVG|nr:hypothetical protein PVAP13_7KG054063 [Panicum virgatum]